jgi:ABC-type nitrate/sulfonate/bicarbonate transport system substrate-binding protein
MKLAIPDLISNSYFPAIAAVELGCFAAEGLDVDLELMVPIETAFDGMRAGRVQFVGASAHLMVGGFPEWRGIKLLCAQAQGMYWYLVMRADLGLARGDLTGLRNCRIGAAPWVGMGLRRLLVDAGIDAAQRGIEIAPIPGAHSAGINFGVTAALALAEGRVDGFWANGMGPSRRWSAVLFRLYPGGDGRDRRVHRGPPGGGGRRGARDRPRACRPEDRCVPCRYNRP